jgi:CubicO group peptidase (beta-lactamase class C family)
MGSGLSHLYTRHDNKNKTMKNTIVVCLAGRKCAARLILWVLCFLGPALAARAQTDLGTIGFGNVALGLTNAAYWEWYGGEWNGTELVMQVEEFLGPYAADFATTPNYQGQTLSYGQDYPTVLTLAPSVLGLETATRTNYETPNPPFGAYITQCQGTGVAATPGTGPIVPELLPLQEAMTNFLVYHHFEAGTLALLWNDKLVFRQGYGYRDSNYTTVIHPDNLFRLASVSKMLTASAITKLINQGTIATNTLIYSYLGIPPWGGVLGDSRITNITVQELLDHSGGWDYPNGGPEFDTIEISTQMGLDYPAAPTNVISWQFSKPLAFTPGTSNIYSNFGYQILGRIIEKASGKSYADYIQQDLLGSAGVINPIGFTNVIQTHSRPQDRAPWELWFVDDNQEFDNWDNNLTQSAVDFPTNIMLRYVDGGGYWESYDSFGGMSASAIGLCNYLLNYWESSTARGGGYYYGWDYIFYGSLWGITSVLYQDIDETPTTTNGLEFAALFNQRDGLSDNNADAESNIVAATSEITSWPTNGGGMVQWGLGTATVYKNAGSLTVNLVRSGLSTRPVKISYTTYPLTAGSADYESSSGVISFAAGQTNVPITIKLLNNPANLSSEQFLLELISASGGAWLGGNLSCVVNVVNTNVQPRFSGPPSILSGGGFSSQIYAPTGLVLNVDVSSNLLTWQVLRSLTNTNGFISVVDTNAPKRKASFYRLTAP